MANIDKLIRTNINEIVDPNVVSEILSSPPFIQIDGTFNFRDISDGTTSGLRKNFFFRSGSLENISPRGIEELKKLGINTILDLRSAREVSAYPDPEIEGMEIVAMQADSDPTSFMKFASVAESYLAMLETHKDYWRKVLEHVRDDSDKRLLVHCTAGRDRTGIAIALILGIAGLSFENISREYALTRIGVEPVRDFLLAKGFGGKEVDLKSERLQALMRTDPDVMETFLQEVKTRFGGVEGYVVQVLGFEQSDLEIMRQNLQGS